MTIQHGIDELVENFEFLDDWEERYRYVIELGKALEPLPAEDHREELKVQGCVSQVWLRADRHMDGRLRFVGDSDAHIVRGLIAILLSIYSDRTPAEILAIDSRDIFERLGLNEHLTPQRSNGLAAMVQRVRAHASGTIPPHGEIP